MKLSSWLILIGLVIQVGFLNAKHNRRSLDARSSCPGRCLYEAPQRYQRHRYFVRMHLFDLQEFIRYFLYETRGAGLLPDVSHDVVEEACERARTMRSCLSNCTAASDRRSRAKYGRVVNITSTVLCDPAVQRQYDCLQNVSKHASAHCKQRCDEYRQAVLRGQNENGTSSGGFGLPETIRGLCKLVNCRLYCSKSNIITSCDQTAFEAAKNFVRGLGRLTKEYFSFYDIGYLYPRDACSVEALLREPSLSNEELLI